MKKFQSPSNDKIKKSKEQMIVIHDDVSLPVFGPKTKSQTTMEELFFRGRHFQIFENLFPYSHQ